jgi:hypothetical protein
MEQANAKGGRTLIFERQAWDSMPCAMHHGPASRRAEAHSLPEPGLGFEFERLFFFWQS